MPQSKAFVPPIRRCKGEKAHAPHVWNEHGKLAGYGIVVMVFNCQGREVDKPREVESDD